jgi:hypothetical protein
MVVPKMPLALVFVFLVVLAVLLVPDPTHAQMVPVVPAAVTNCGGTVANFNGGNTAGFSTCNQTATASDNVGGAFNTGTIMGTVNNTRTPSIQIGATATGSDFAYGSVTEIYYLTVIAGPGLPGNIYSVPIDVLGQYNLTATSIFTGTNGILFEIYDASNLASAIFGVDNANQDIVNGKGEPVTVGFETRYDTPLYFFNNIYKKSDTYEILMAVDVDAGSNTTTASLDPYFFIDPSFAYADDVSLVFSSGINNIAPSSITPTPSSWFLLLSGLAVAACFNHRRAFGGVLRKVFRTSGAIAIATA